VSEMVWQMDAQIAKLTEAMKQAAKAEEAVARAEKLGQETSALVDAATASRRDAERENARLAKDTTALLDIVRAQVDLLAVRKKEFEAFDERVGALTTAVGDAESRMNGLAARDKNVAALAQGVDNLSKRYETLFVQGDELGKKQAALDALGDRLAEVD